MTAKKPSGTHLNDLRVIDLKLELEKRSLETKGVKKELTERLSKASKPWCALSFASFLHEVPTTVEFWDAILPNLYLKSLNHPFASFALLNALINYLSLHCLTIPTCPQRDFPSISWIFLVGINMQMEFLHFPQLNKNEQSINETNILQIHL